MSQYVQMKWLRLGRMDKGGGRKDIPKQRASREKGAVQEQHRSGRVPSGAVHTHSLLMYHTAHTEDSRWPPCHLLRQPASERGFPLLSSDGNRLLSEGRDSERELTSHTHLKRVVGSRKGKPPVLEAIMVRWASDVMRVCSTVAVDRARFPSPPHFV